ncbi:metal/formaldehyde-sensitive transcriptional repressor [Oxalicibacterium faecigallinarum]|uniref:Metal/formaldehyde-sensitive transcriptional repressor n=1 Tax=Oxalicibacterium faecigallinarum TaxID=573741 RepID=A0A8J3AVC2_9BURK|nr:metal/formaldehyde-sensitive transcriptional repressor [Oxalicibacterium faecigallinarum]GGI16863.1 hypothetical protein GCM10008066_06090 [Oxalicibacterium faecigallinarum]
MAHTMGDKKLLARVRRMKGQVQAVEKALESGAECGDILQQIAAIRGAANGLMNQVLESHIREHLGAEHVSADTRQADLEQVVGVLRSYLK